MPEKTLLMDPKTLDVHIWRERGRVMTNLPHRQVVRHSPTGYEIGYGGSGPADLALNILLFFERQMVDDDALPLEDARITNALYQDFKWDWIAPLERFEPAVIAGRDIIAWIWQRTGAPAEYEAVDEAVAS